MNVYFIAKQLGSNYLMQKKDYANLCNGNFHHVVYLYWILKNKKIKNIHLNLVTNLPKNMEKSDIVFFHYDTKDKIDFNNYITVQVIGDYPKLEQSNYYITHNPQMADEKHFFMHFPLPVNIKKLNPVFPPKNFVGVGSAHSFNKTILKQSYIDRCKKYGINLKFITDVNYCNTKADVFIFLRDKKLHLYRK